MKKALIIFFFLVISLQPAYAAETDVYVPNSNTTSGSDVTVHNPSYQSQPIKPTVIVTVVVTSAPTPSVMPTIIYKVIYRTVTPTPSPTLTPTATPSATSTKAPTPTKMQSHKATQQISNIFQKIARFFQNIFQFLHRR